MSDTREILRRGLDGYEPPTDGYERVLRRRDRRRRNQRLASGAVAAAVVLTGAVAFLRALDSDPVPADPPPPSAGWVVYPALEPSDGVPTRDTGPTALYAALPGQAPQRLTGGADLRLTCPSFSADGTKLAYGERNIPGDVTTIVVAPFEDGRLAEPQRRFASDGDGMQPCAEWSKDGWLAMLDEAGVLHVGDPDGAITAFLGARTSSPSVWSEESSHLMFEWSPDGTRIAVVAGPEILVAPRSGGGLEAVMTLPAGAEASSVAWSPDGSMLLVAGNSGTQNGCCDGSVPHLWSISVDVADHPVTEVPINSRRGMAIFQVLWSPHNEVAVAVAIGAQSGYRVMLVDPRAGTQDITEDVPWVQSSVRLSPDGTQLLFVGPLQRSLASAFVTAVPLRGGQPVKYAPMTTEGPNSDPGELAWQPVPSGSS